MSESSKEMVTALNLYVLQCIVEVANNGNDGVAEAMLRFGIDRVLVERLKELNIPLLLEIAQSPTFLFSINQGRLYDSLKDRESGHGYRSMHRAIASIGRKP